MGYVVRMPKLGMEMKEGTLLSWYVNEGDAVTEDEVLAEFEAEKTTAEITARETGVLRRVYVEEGETVAPGTPVGIVAAIDDDIADLEADAEGASDAAVAPTESKDETDKPTVPATASTGGVKATPKARKRAADLDIDLAGLEGTGYQGAVTAEDVERAAETTSDGATMTLSEERAFDGMRRTIADRLGESYRNAVHVTVHREVDADSLLRALDAARDSLDVEVTLTDLLVRAVSETLTEHPEFNGTVEEGVHQLYEEHNVGVAVDTDDGLVVPVVPDVASKSLAELAETRAKLTEAAAAGQITMDAFRNGTFTVTNLGPLNVDSFTPIINPPQTAILGVNRVSRRPAVDDETASRRTISFALSFDHRAVDGADAARFLETLAGHVRDGQSLVPDSVTDSDGSSDGEESSVDRTVSVHTDGGLAGQVTAGSFEWRVDEPEEVGGSGTAPSPVDRFLGSLAACLAVSIGFQARKRDVTLSSVDVEVEGWPKRGTLRELRATVNVQGETDEEGLNELVELGERGCFVSELLRDDLDFVVRREGRDAA